MSEPTPEQQAERAAAWKAYREAPTVATAQRAWESGLSWWAFDPQTSRDGVTYLPDGTTREAE